VTAAPTRPPAERDHLFISYAWEEGALAEWLYRKLTALGYLVWCDRFKMFGGEQWPKDIDVAIKTRTYRMLALLSRASLAKPNPRKERQIALALSRERGEEDFLIPLNVEGIRPTELGWELSDINFIPFQRWSDGLAQLLRKLEEVGAHRPLIDRGPALAAETFIPPSVLKDEGEPLVSNCLRVTTVPPIIHRFQFSRDVAEVERRELQKRWAFEKVDSRKVLAFTQPPMDSVPECAITAAGGSSWRDVDRIEGIKAQHVARSLVKKSVTVHGLSLGLLPTEDGSMAYFPPGLFPQEKLWYRDYTGRKNYVGVVGERRFGKGRSRYQLGATFWLRTDVLNDWAIQVKLRLHLTDPSGKPIEPRAVNSRRKKITKGWWNHEWLARHLALVAFLAGGRDGSVDAPGEIVIGATPAEQIRLSARLESTVVRPAIDDEALESLRTRVEAIRLAEETAAQDSDDAEEREEPGE
jgi:hypothetical protein